MSLHYDAWRVGHDKWHAGDSACPIHREARGVALDQLLPHQASCDAYGLTISPKILVDNAGVPIAKLFEIVCEHSTTRGVDREEVRRQTIVCVLNKPVNPEPAAS